MGIARGSLAAVVVSTALATAAHAGDAVRVDWSKGVVLADGLGVADRHAPSPAVARSTSRRAAEDDARAHLRAELGKLPLAAGGTVAGRAKDAAIQARLDQAIDDAFAFAAEPETDGAWRVTLAVPLEAVRQAIDGPRALAVGGDDAAAVVVVDGAAVPPSIGYRVGADGATTIFVADVPEWARAAPRVHGKHAQKAAIELDRVVGGPATLFVIVMAKP
jgi:hypothetical protein